jgi:hypothetical protein
MDQDLMELVVQAKDQAVTPTVVAAEEHQSILKTQRMPFPPE